MLNQIALPTAAGSVAGTSPEYVRISMAGAIALRLRSGRFSRDLRPGGINLLLTYDEGCLSDCGYCGLARTRAAGHEVKSFIRVEWPLVRTDEVVERIGRYAPALTRICISMVTHGHAYRDTCGIARRIASRSRVPMSVLVAPPALNRERLEDLKSTGVDMIGIGLDAVTEELFGNIRTNVARGGLRWPRYWDAISSAREVFGPWKVNVHTVVGLGETDAELLALLVALRDRQIFPYLFCFNPEPGTRMAAQPKPSLRRWRRAQLARQLIVSEGYGLGQFGFDDDGRLVRVRAVRRALEASLAEGTAFMTDGCPGEAGEPGCTRPFGSYRPGEPFRDYPFAPGASDLEEIRRSLELGDLVGAAAADGGLGCHVGGLRGQGGGLRCQGGGLR
jgi:biotin synthase